MMVFDSEALTQEGPSSIAKEGSSPVLFYGLIVTTLMPCLSTQEGSSLMSLTSWRHFRAVWADRMGQTIWPVCLWMILIQ